jgi:hypothetical protein
VSRIAKSRIDRRYMTSSTMTTGSVRTTAIAMRMTNGKYLRLLTILRASLVACQ